jgi:hypothetical protein
VPVGRIAYHNSYAQTTQICSLMADTWEAILDMIAAGPSGESSLSSLTTSIDLYTVCRVSLHDKPHR